MRVFHFYAGAVLAAGAFTAPANGQSADAPSYRIHNHEGELIGTQLATSSIIGQHDAGDHNLRIERQLEFTIDGHDLTRSSAVLTIEMRGRSWRKIEYTHKIGGQTRRIIAHLDGEYVTILRRGESDPVYQTVATQLPYAQPEMLLGLPEGAFLTFDPSRGQIVEREGQFIALPTRFTEARELYLVTEAGQLVAAFTVAYDEAGEIVELAQPSFGGSFVYTSAQPSVVRETRLRGARIDHPMITAPFDIPNSAKQGHMRYWPELPQAIAVMLPQTAEQAVRYGNDGVQIDICAACGPGLPDDPASLARWTQPTAWLQSDDRRILAAARAPAAKGVTQSEVMELLARIARRRLSGVDFAGHYSASTAWRRRSGDCTEDAVVLAALARAAGIPALVASGMVYTRERYHGTHDAFIPHSWVIAHVDGAWRSFDITLDDGFDATHIALTVGEGDAQSVAASYTLAGLAQWDRMAEIRARPATD